MFGPIALQPFLDTVGNPQQGKFAQRGQVAHPEVVAERSIDLLGSVHIPVRKSPSQRFGTHVHKFELVGRAHDCIRDRLPLLDARDRLDDVVQGLQMLDVHRGDDVDARVE